jgi:hypothetical protein
VYSLQYHCNFQQDVGERRVFRLTLLVLINYVNFYRDIVISGLCDSLARRTVKMDSLLQQRKQTSFLNTLCK